jgi:4-hydroxy 2-oxovalerate aldolase
LTAQGGDTGGTGDTGARKIDSWVTFRPELKLLDCTIRDGGLMNDHRFEDSFVQRVYETCAAAGIDYMEVGYKADRKIFVDSKAGPWKFCSEDDLRRIVGENASATGGSDGTGIKLSVMADAERTDYHTDILPRDQSVLSCIRVAAYVHQVPTALDMIKDARSTSSMSSTASAPSIPSRCAT